MQLNTNTKQLNSKEYKLILDYRKFKGTENEDRAIVTSAIEDAIKNQNLRFEKALPEIREKKVWYLDTDKHELHNKKFTVRVKEKWGTIKQQATFKIRDSDKELVKSYDLFTVNQQPVFEIDEQKFEEDIIAKFKKDGGLGPENKFSISTELKYNEEPNLKTCNDMLRIFPNLKLDVPQDSPLSDVNDLKVKETNYKLGEIYFKDKKKAEFGLSVWCILDKPDIDKPDIVRLPPVIAEFDIDVNAKDLLPIDENNNDVFSDPAIAEIREFYNNMSSESIVDKTNKTMTKTEFVYNYKKEN